MIKLEPHLTMLDSRAKDLDSTRYGYKLAHSQYGLDVAFGDSEWEVDEKRMSLVIPFADGKSRDGVGDLLEVGGIRTERHRQNPVILLDHAKNYQLPIALAEDPDTKEYTVTIDTMTQRATMRAFFYRGKGMESIAKDQEYDHALFCEQLFDLTAKRYIRAGSIGYQIIKALQLPPDYEKGTPQGLHLLSVLMLEGSLVVLPANQDTVRKALSMDKVCGKPLSPYLVKTLTPLAETPKVQANGFDVKSVEKVKSPQSQYAFMIIVEPAYDWSSTTQKPTTAYGAQTLEEARSFAQQFNHWEIRRQTATGFHPVESKGLTKSNMKSLRKKYKNFKDLSIGDKVNHPRFGEGWIVSIDSTTYSIPMVTVQITKGNLKGEKIVRSLVEFTSKGKNLPVLKKAAGNVDSGTISRALEALGIVGEVYETAMGWRIVVAGGKDKVAEVFRVLRQMFPHVSASPPNEVVVYDQDKVPMAQGRHYREKSFESQSVYRILVNGQAVQEAASLSDAIMLGKYEQRDNPSRTRSLWHIGHCKNYISGHRLYPVQTIVTRSVVRGSPQPSAVIQI